MKIKHLEPCLLANTFNSSTGEAEEENHCKAPASQGKTVQKGVKRTQRNWDFQSMTKVK